MDICNPSYLLWLEGCVLAHGTIPTIATDDPHRIRELEEIGVRCFLVGLFVVISGITYVGVMDAISEN